MWKVLSMKKTNKIWVQKIGSFCSFDNYINYFVESQSKSLRYCIKCSLQINKKTQKTNKNWWLDQAVNIWAANMNRYSTSFIIREIWVQLQCHASACIPEWLK